MEGVINGETWFAGNITMMQEEGIEVDTKKILMLTKEGKTPIFLARK